LVTTTDEEVAAATEEDVNVEPAEAGTRETARPCGPRHAAVMMMAKNVRAVFLPPSTS
jgi:hypothetical protein